MPARTPFERAALVRAETLKWLARHGLAH